jgi:hypothetical protein
MAKRDSWLVVARGAGWALSWPRERWEQLTPEQQQDVIAAQVALMSQNVPQNGTRRTPVRVLTAEQE